MTEVMVVGSVNMDLVVEAGHLPAAGETVLAGDLVIGPGGKGGNQAVAAARLGARTTLFAATGDDHFGARLRAALEGEGLDTSQVAVVPGVPTGVAMVVVSPAGQNQIAVAPGANRWLAEPHLRALAHARDAVVLLQLEIPAQTCLAAARLARPAGARLVLNAAPLADPLPAGVAAVLAEIDVLVVNEGEALALSRQPAPADLAGWARLADGLRQFGPAAAVVTLGERGAVAAEPGATYLQPAFPAEVVDSTGAGDAFCGALAVGLAQRLPLAVAVRRACAVGAIATGRVGAQAGLPTNAELERLLGAGPAPPVDPVASRAEVN